MKKFLLLTFALSLTFLAQAQGALEDFAGQLTGGEVSFKYSFEVQGDVPVKGSGTAVLKGNAFHIFGNGLEIWCDGKTRWTIDRGSREAYIETVEIESVDYLANPATLLGALTRAFQINSVSDVTLSGKKLQAFNLTPSIDDTGLKSVMLYMDGSTPSRVAITVEDGTKTLFRLSDYAVKEKSDAGFSFDIASLGSDFVVTDLR